MRKVSPVRTARVRLPQRAARWVHRLAHGLPVPWMALLFLVLPTHLPPHGAPVLSVQRCSESRHLALTRFQQQTPFPKYFPLRLSRVGAARRPNPSDGLDAMHLARPRRLHFVGFACLWCRAHPSTRLLVDDSCFVPPLMPVVVTRAWPDKRSPPHCYQPRAVRRGRSVAADGGTSSTLGVPARPAAPQSMEHGGQCGQYRSKSSSYSGGWCPTGR